MVGFSKPEIRSVLIWSTAVLFLTSLMPGRAAATEFGKPLNVSRSRARIDTLAAIAVDANNKVHIAWNAFYAKTGAPDGIAGDIYYATNASGRFSAPVRIRVAAGWYSRDVAIAVDPAGHAHVVFRRSTSQLNVLSDDDLYYVTDAKGDFKHPVLLIDGVSGAPGPGAVAAPHNPLVHCDRRGRVHVTCLANSIGAQAFPVVYLSCRSGAWTKPALAVRGDFLNEHSSAVDPSGFVHIAFNTYDKNNKEFLYYVHNRAGKFSRPVKASAASHDNPFQFQLAVDGRAKAHLVYRAPFVHPGTPDLFYVNNATGSFKSWKPVCDSSVYYISQVAVDSAGVAHIAYKRTPAYDGHLYYGNNASGAFKFSAYAGLGSNWYGWPGYFALGKNGSLHFAVYDFPDPESWEAEIYYISGSWTQGFAGVPLFAGKSF